MTIPPKPTYTIKKFTASEVILIIIIFEVGIVIGFVSNNKVQTITDTSTTTITSTVTSITSGTIVSSPNEIPIYVIILIMIGMIIAYAIGRMYR